MSAFSSNDEVTLISGDGEEFKVSSKVAVLSALAAGMISDDDQDEEKRIPLPNVRREILAKVLEFCNHYHEEKMTEFVKVNAVNYHSPSLNITRHSVCSIL
jgi:S-phase kinase-associated protein 1